MDKPAITGSPKQVILIVISTPNGKDVHTRMTLITGAGQVKAVGFNSTKNTLLITRAPIQVFV